MRRLPPADSALVLASLCLVVGCAFIRNPAYLASVTSAIFAFAFAMRVDLLRLSAQVFAATALFAIPSAVAIATGLGGIPGSTRVRLQAAELIVLRPMATSSIVLLLLNLVPLQALSRVVADAPLPRSITSAFLVFLHQVQVLRRIAGQMVSAFRMRSLRRASFSQATGVVGVQGAVLFRKTYLAAETSHRAMLARGFAGEYPDSLDQKQMNARDYLLVALAIVASVAGVIL